MQVPFARQFGQYDTAVQTMFVLVGLLFVLGFIYFVILLSAKLLGIVLLLGGLWFALYFPGEMDYQRSSFGGTGKLIGFIALAIGLALVIFG
jgi:hypothetical protein